MSRLSKLGLVLAAAVLSLPLSAVARPGMHGYGMHGYGSPVSPVRYAAVAYDNSAMVDQGDSDYQSEPLPCARSYAEDDYGTTRTVNMDRDQPTYGGSCGLHQDAVETYEARDDDAREVVYDDMPPPPPGAVPCTCVMTGGYARRNETYTEPTIVRREVIVREAPRREGYSSGYSASSGSAYEETYSETSNSRASYGEGYAYGDGDRVSYDEDSDGRYDDARHDDDSRRDHAGHRRHHDRDGGQSDDRAHHDVWFNRY